MPPNFNAQYWCLMISKNGNDNGNSRPLGTPLCPFLHVCKPTSWRAGDPLRWWDFISFQFIDKKKLFLLNPPKRPSLKHSLLMVFIHRWHSPSMDCPWHPLRWHRCNPRLVSLLPILLRITTNMQIMIRTHRSVLCSTLLFGGLMIGNQLRVSKEIERQGMGKMFFLCCNMMIYRADW